MLTYGQLTGLLSQLNYRPDQSRSAATYTVFRHPEREVAVILPVMDDRTQVQAMHLAMIRRVLQESNDSAVGEFDRLLASHGHPDSLGVTVA